MPKDLRLADIASRFFHGNACFKTTLFQAYSCSSDVQYVVDHFFNKISADPTVDRNHPISFLIGNFGNLDLWITHEFQYVDVEKQFIFFSKIDKIPAPKCALIILASPVIHDGETTHTGPAQTVFGIYKSLLLGMFGRGFLLDLVTQFTIEGSGEHRTSFASGVWRTPQTFDTRAIVDPAIYDDLIICMRSQTDPLRARLVLACQFFSRANEESYEYKRFFDYWTALEIVANGKSQRVRNLLAQAYGAKLPYVDKTLRFKEISDLRHDLIHNGIFKSLEPEVERRMQGIFLDLLRFQLGLTCKRITGRLGV